MEIETTGIAHIALRVTDSERTAAFYEEVLGFTKMREMPGLVLFNAYGMVFAVRGGAEETPPGDAFDPFRVGLDHLALGIPGGPPALDALHQQLEAAGVPNNGVQTDEMSGAAYISFYDPDGIAWEFYPARDR